MPFEFQFLDWLQTLRTPIMNALAIFFDTAGAHGEVWIVMAAVLLCFRRTRKAGIAAALALILYLLVGNMMLKPFFARPRPCDLRAVAMLVPRPHGHSFPSGHTASAFAAAFALWLEHKRLGTGALAVASFIGFTRLYLYVHFPTDVLGGILLGCALGAAGAYIANFLAKKSKLNRNV